ncbi:TetR/AcrR family transcriptional regulator [Ectopseudomonas mendocina]|uniref:TetR/AcrR family transcriptional regulator n=1 Tax=Ectopseudomonas mendocina TaxID=300 RepID=A0ABZ2RG57_ECTME
MAAPRKTRDRIIQESLALFNAQGERNVTTNHIAAHLGISPGNLYYYFRNKQMIIAELFALLESQVDAFLRRPQERVLTVEDKTFYLEAVLATMWHYRFFHRDLEHLLESDTALAERYQRFSRRCLEQARDIYQGFVEAGILRMTADQIEALTLNGWIIMTSWIRFLCTSRGSAGDLSEDLLRRGVYQILTLESGYVTEQASEAVEALKKRLYVPLDQVI